jgi:membrane protein YdbS with pleckstrin-like domain
MKPLDIPRYRTRPVSERFIFSGVSVILIIAVILYVALYIFYVSSGDSTALLISIWFAASWSLVIILYSISSYVKYSQYSYVIYGDRIEFFEPDRRLVMISEISHLSQEHDIIDRIFKTDTIKLFLKDKRSASIMHIRDANQLYFMMQKMIRH